MKESIHFTPIQLHKLRRQFFHPSVEKLLNLIKKAHPEHATKETRQALQDIISRCDPCQQTQTAPLRYRVSFGAENGRFNEQIIINIMYLNGISVLHIVEEGKHFSSARFIPNIQADTLLKTILESWPTIYTGMSHRILVDQSSFFGEPFANLSRIGGIEV